MTNLSRRALAALGLVLAAAPAFAAAPALARTAIVIPPPPQPKIATESAALAALRHDGIRKVERLGRVGDYWESEGLLDGRPVVAYLYADGALEVQPATATALLQAFGALPRPARIS